MISLGITRDCNHQRAGAGEAENKKQRNATEPPKKAETEGAPKPGAETETETDTASPRTAGSWSCQGCRDNFRDATRLALIMNLAPIACSFRFDSTAT